MVALDERRALVHHLRQFISGSQSRELDGLTSPPLVPRDMDYDPRDGTATFGIGVYTAYLPKPGPA